MASLSAQIVTTIPPYPESPHCLTVRGLNFQKIIRGGCFVSGWTQIIAAAYLLRESRAIPYNWAVNQTSPKIKVAHVITRLIVGGAQENTIYTVLGLNRMPGYEVVLLTGPQAGPEGSLMETGWKEEVPCIVWDTCEIHQHLLADLMDHFHEEEFEHVWENDARFMSLFQPTLPR